MSFLKLGKQIHFISELREIAALNMKMCDSKIKWLEYFYDSTNSCSITDHWVQHKTEISTARKLNLFMKEK
jgi:hypothetical protein